VSRRPRREPPVCGHHGNYERTEAGKTNAGDVRAPTAGDVGNGFLQGHEADDEGGRETKAGSQSAGSNHRRERTCEQDDDSRPQRATLTGDRTDGSERQRSQAECARRQPGRDSFHAADATC
jgi:hypothetical protein